MMWSYFIDPNSKFFEPSLLELVKGGTDGGNEDDEMPEENPDGANTKNKKRPRGEKKTKEKKRGDKKKKRTKKTDDAEEDPDAEAGSLDRNCFSKLGIHLIHSPKVSVHATKTDSW